MSEKKKYLFVFLKTGGGHLAPARAISNYMSKHFPNIAEPILIYGFEKTPHWVKYIIEDGYGMLQYTGRWFFELLYFLHKIQPIARITSFLVGNFMKKYLEATILQEKPNKIIILHFFCISPILKILKKHNISIPVQILITDPFTPHPLWFLKKRQNLIVFSKELESKVNKRNKGHNVVRFSFPIDEKFSKILSADEVNSIKKRLGYNPSKKLVLMLGGGDGVPKGEKLLQRLLETKFEHEIGIVCGKNTLLRQAAEDQKKRYNANNLNIYGYVDFIYDLLNISDLVITKCGASTIMEILNLKKVPIVIDYIWEQEQGNVDYIKNKKLGIYEPHIKKLRGLIKNLLEDDELRLSYKKNIDMENIGNGVKEVAEFLTL